MKTEEKDLGTFNIESGEIIISDPCYEKDTWCNQIKKAKNGVWETKILIQDHNDWGKRVSDLFVCHEDYNFLDGDYRDWENIGDCGVDSGQLGVFDLKYFKDNNDKSLDDIPEAEICKDEKFYNRMCYLTLADSDGEGIFGGKYLRGVNVCSGFGDGNYLVKAVIKDGIVVAVWVNFISDDDEEFED